MFTIVERRRRKFLAFVWSLIDSPLNFSTFWIKFFENIFLIYKDLENFAQNPYI